MSPSEPPIRISEPRASKYAFDTHCCAGRPPPRSRSIAGSATLTIDPSTAATPEPRIAATNVRRCLRLMGVLVGPRSPRRRLRRSLSSRRVGCVQHAGEPVVDRARDLLPALADHEQVRPALELEVLGAGGRALVLLVLRA